MKYYLISVVMGVFVGNLLFCVYQKYLLIMLLMLEFLVVNIFMLLNMYLSFINGEFYFVLIFLVLTVCEGALGVGILVNMLRSNGSDYFNNFSILI
uniref:NADH-ubiquinone oxidoreductase chain 4L n=1 Tax=Adicella ragma TaxID=2904898 RepID=A0A9E8RSJ9_9NEOP|nr:NADH dehydrogenase subunit 4L [Adicella ragma]UZZ43723.1 NADH dehydrogenase subunit 4L [Adicella ragma]